MRQFLNAINNSPHAEERSGAAGTRLEARTTTDAAHLAQPLRYTRPTTPG
jgi:hypothetical protein